MIERKVIENQTIKGVITGILVDEHLEKIKGSIVGIQV